MTVTKQSGNPVRPYHHGDLRTALLRAAELELVDKGVEGFTLRGCAKRAGVSHGAPAHHFADANAMLTELAALGFRRFLQAQQNRKDHAASDPQSQLIAAGLGYLDFAKSNPALFRLMFSAERTDVRNPSFAEAAHDAFRQLVEDVATVMGENTEQSAEAQLAVAASWAVVHGMAHLMISRRLPYRSLMDQDADDETLTQIMKLAFPK